MYLAQRIVDPTQEPLSIQELKDQVRVDTDREDGWFQAAAVAAREYVEWRTGRTLYQTTWEMVWDRFPTNQWFSFLTSARHPLVLPFAYPLISVSFVKYTDSSATTTTWDPTNYQVNTDASPGFILPVYGVPWPVYVPQLSASVRVRYVAGLDPTADPLVEPPGGLRAAIALLVAAMYENREADIMPPRSGIAFISSRFGIDAMIDQHRVIYPF